MADEEILDYEEDEQEERMDVTNDVVERPAKSALDAPRPTATVPRSIIANEHSADWKDFLLKPDILKAIYERGFEKPSGNYLAIFVFVSNFSSRAFVHLDVQVQCLSEAIVGTDIICQAKSGTGKTGASVKF